MPDKLVGVLDKPLFPRGVRVSEIDLGVQHFCDVLVFSELSSVVGGDGKDMTLERPEQLDYDLGHSLCVLSLRGLCHEHLLCGALHDGDNGSFAVLADDGVQFPVAET